MLTILAKEHCRIVFHYFRDRGTETATAEDLVGFLNRRSDGDATADSVAIRLHHSVLPQLAEAGLVDYDARTNAVRYRGHPALEMCLNEVVEDGEIPA
ncbi:MULTISPECIES: DUF7344 domain-containing protein [Halorussus]|uniref:DUF7344 domain-containing protein n=1 Tax=Halorussus TaxID=1070314 RepID=UPI0020A1296C|nr:hypothetical protein [Halorussus vallis]USZ75258.1 hypothetical protein NGM07_17725 [Halorussus vallis]